MKPDLGFIGLGHLGGAIALRLAQLGYRLHVHDVNPASCQAAVAAGATAHDSAAQVADAASVIFACLPTVESAREVALGERGAIHGSAIQHYIEMSTIGTSAVCEIAAALEGRGIALVDAPVSGGPERTRTGDLTVMAAAPSPVLEAVMPVLQALTSRVMIVSDIVGQAQAAKLVNNLVAAANFASAFEALVLGAKLGLDVERLAAIINVSSGQSSGFSDRKIQAVLSRRFDNGGRAGLLAKDCELGLDEANRLGFPVQALRVLTGAAAYWGEVAQAGLGDDDVAAAIRLLERAAQVQVAHGTGFHPTRHS